jgi:hypothetical protein
MMPLGGESATPRSIRDSRSAAHGPGHANHSAETRRRGQARRWRNANCAPTNTIASELLYLDNDAEGHAVHNPIDLARARAVER